MSIVSTTLELVNEQEQQVAWKLLRAKNAPAIIAILDEHLGGTERKLPVNELVSLVEVDLEELRFRANLELNRSAQAYCDAWRADGYLIRRPVAQTRQETYELSAGAAAAISFAKRLVQPRRTATQSRLNTIIDQISNLALATNQNEEHRRAVLLEERSRIDSQLAQLDEGILPVIDGDEALERLQDVLSLTQEIPDDFAHVREDFEHINKAIHATLIDTGVEHSDVLEEIFSGVDQISQSAAGRSFRGFYLLLRDTDLTESVQDDIDAILSSDYAGTLTIAERRFLRDLITNFTEQSQEVNAVMTSFARGLRRFVQSQEYQQERALKQELEQALAKAHEVIDCYPAGKKLHFELSLTAVSLLSASRWKLKNPVESRAASAEELVASVAETMTLAELRQLARETEIDFAELVTNVNSCIDEALAEGELDAFDTPNILEVLNAPSTPSISIAQVLERFPASQGVASVVGLVVLATEQGRACRSTTTTNNNNNNNNNNSSSSSSSSSGGGGTNSRSTPNSANDASNACDENSTELVRWQAKDASWRQAHIERWEFFREVEL